MTALPKGLPDKYIEETKRSYRIEPFDDNQNFVNREFFTGHKLQIIFMCFIENGLSLISIDSNAHIFIWKY